VCPIAHGVPIGWFESVMMKLMQWWTQNYGWIHMRENSGPTSDYFNFNSMGKGITKMSRGERVTLKMRT
jgi:hypothetical protein